jgi:hypothetical protein
MSDTIREQVIELVRTLPAEQLHSLYDFALFLQFRPPRPTPFEDLFGESEEELRADEARWDEQFARSGDGLLRLAEEAAEEYRAGRTAPMEFDKRGRLRR